MPKLPWSGSRLKLRRLSMAALPAVAALGVAMAASSTPRDDLDRTAERVARITQGDLTPEGLAALKADLDPAIVAQVMRLEGGQAGALALTPGWETLTLAGKPGSALGDASGFEALKLNAATPTMRAALRPALPFRFSPSTTEDRRRALRCLTQAVYYEAALESTAGQEGVAQVVLNRVRDPNYPNTVCGVVFQGAERSTGCQFSFTCDGALANGPVAWAWERARKVAERALNGYVAKRIGTATHYHADYVHPWWAPTLTKIDQIGAHIFYRWNGALGDTPAFRQAYSGKEPLIDEARFARPRVITREDAAAAAGLTLAEAEALPDTAARTVEINGAVRVVGVTSLGGRRQPTPQDIAAINASLEDSFGKREAAATPSAAPPAGVTPMAVEEIGRPPNSGE